MHIKINEDYNVVVNTSILGYVGETNARPVSFEGMEIDGADRYVLTIDYGDGVQYEVDITGGQWTPTADILRSAQTVSCQICAKKLSGQEYILVKKSRIFRLRIGAAIDDTAIPSPIASMDALDRIDAIGRQAHADMQTAVTAAETATTAAESAKKSATATEKSADTATQAASRAETAQASAETSATQAETAMHNAETARAEAVTARNAAKISAAQASTAAQQTTADKTITAGYAKTAKTCADSTTADRQAVQTLATQVTADKATVADHAAQVATDRKAAETAAQTAQSIADSLPGDYVTAVGKIAENTSEIANVKLTDKELKRRVDALCSIGQGITHKFETDTDTAYQKTVPTGGKLMSVKNIGGRSIVFNQMIPDSIIHVTVTIDEDIAEEKWLKQIVADTSPIAQAIGHKVAGKCIRDINNPSSYVTVRFGNNNVNVSNGSERYTTTENGIYTLSSGVGNPPPLYFRAFAGATAGTYKFTLQLFDLTAMFGTGNEPSTVEEFEKMFPATYYPYNAGEIVSAGTEEIVEQGKNLLNADDYYASYKQSDGSYVSDFMSFANITIPVGKYIGKTLIATLKATVPPELTSFFWAARIGGARIESSYAKGERVLANTTGIAKLTFTPKTKNDTLAMSYGTGRGDVIVRDIQFELGDTPTAYAPYHRNEYPIPEAIKALPGYGWSAGTAKNYVDYENKQYHQCVDSVDLGTLTWAKGESVSFKTHQLAGQKPSKSYDIAPNIFCSKYLTKTQNELWGKLSVTGISATSNVGGYIYVNDTSYTDATTFKQTMSGIMLYYELATPIVTDISNLIDDDFLRNLTVEAGGSITFKNGNGDSYRIPVPSEEEYIVKLSEVGGTT